MNTESLLTPHQSAHLARLNVVNKAQSRLKELANQLQDKLDMLEAFYDCVNRRIDMADYVQSNDYLQWNSLLVNELDDIRTEMARVLLGNPNLIA